MPVETARAKSTHLQFPRPPARTIGLAQVRLSLGGFLLLDHPDHDDAARFLTFGVAKQGPKPTGFRRPGPVAVPEGKQVV